MKIYDFTLAVLLSVLIALPTLADDCKSRSATVLSQIDSRLEEVINSQESGRQALLDQFLPRISDADERTRAQKAIEHLVATAKIDDKRSGLYQAVESAYLKKIEEIGEGEPCDNFDANNASVERVAQDLDSDLSTLKKEVEGRLLATNLKPDEGFAIIAVYSSGFAHTISLNKRRSLRKSLQIGPLFNEQYFQVVKMKAGEYNWSTVKLGRNRPYYSYDFSDRDLSFKIEPGKLNYTGVYVFERLGSGRAFADINDRAAVVLQIMERKYPDYLQTYEIANGLVPDDPFIDFYLAEKTRLQGGVQ